MAATVNGEPITARDFEMAYRNAEESLLRNNPGLTREQLKAQQLGRQVLRDLVTQSLLRQEAARMGISVSPLELRLAVGQIKAFQNDKGDFDPAAYKRVLQAQRLSPADFEQETSADLLRRKLFALVTAGAWTDPAEARQRYNFLRQKRTVDYIFLPASNFMDKVKPTDAQAQAYYEAHKAAFAVPAKVKAAYIRVRPQDLVNPENIDAAAARRWYDANSARFTQEEQVKAAHILVPLAEDAPQAEVRKAQETAASIEKELAAGKSLPPWPTPTTAPMPPVPAENWAGSSAAPRSSPSRMRPLPWPRPGLCPCTQSLRPAHHQGGRKKVRRRHPL